MVRGVTTPFPAKLMVVTICVLFVIGMHVRETVARPAPDQVAAMAEALKMLQQLDRHYAQIAKPSLRSDRIVHYDGAIKRQEIARKLQRLYELDQKYSKLTKPRFGRSLDLQTYVDNNENDPNVFQEETEEYRR